MTVQAGDGGQSLAGNQDVRDVFVAGARNLHAVEKQATQLINRQLDRVETYPEVAARLRQHFDETKRQEERLERILSEFDTSRSVIKDVALEFMGNMAALGHTAAEDEILKNTFANLAFENFEIASYKSLITIGELGGFNQQVDLLRQSLEEEKQMARWIDDNIGKVTTQYVMAREQGAQSKR